jgi:hypothetical protein
MPSKKPKKPVKKAQKNAPKKKAKVTVKKPTPVKSQNPKKPVHKPEKSHAVAKAAPPNAAAGKPNKAILKLARALDPKAHKAPEKGHKPGAEAAKGTAGAQARGTDKPRKQGRRTPTPRRGPNGEILAPGELLLPAGTLRLEEQQYLFRGCIAAEHASIEEGVADVVAKRGEAERAEAERQAKAMVDRFESGTIEPIPPMRTSNRRTFQGVAERARFRRREIGAFLRGLDIGRTETSHMDSHGEASLQSLMEWAARLENLADADEPGNADYAQFHRGLDQLDNTTEALMIDVEQTLRRRRDRKRLSS